MACAHVSGKVSGLDCISTQQFKCIKGEGDEFEKVCSQVGGKASSLTCLFSESTNNPTKFTDDESSDDKSSGSSFIPIFDIMLGAVAYFAF